MKFFIFVALVLVLGGLGSSIHGELTEVERNALFDIFIEIPDEYQNVNIDEDILFTLKLVNLGGAGRIDVFLEYSVLDVNREVVLDKRETVAIETQASFLRELNLEGIPVGDYEIYAKMIYADGKTVDGRHSFKIKSAEAERNVLIWIIAGIVLLIGLAIFLYPKMKLIRDKMRIKSQVRKIVRKSRVQG